MPRAILHCASGAMGQGKLGRSHACAASKGAIGRSRWSAELLARFLRVQLAGEYGVPPNGPSHIGVALASGPGISGSGEERPRGGGAKCAARA